MHIQMLYSVGLYQKSLSELKVYTSKCHVITA